MSQPRPLIAAALAAALLAPLPTAGAQPGTRARPSVSASAGVSQYDLSGTGTAPMGALRADYPLDHVLLVEGGVSVARPDQQFGQTTTFVVPEVGLQLQLPRRLAPYLGIGAGAAIDFRGDASGGTQSDPTVSGAAGLRAWLTDQVGLRGELRVRGIGTGFEGAAAEWTFGVSWRP
jgi:hypothetical protein